MLSNLNPIENALTIEQWADKVEEYGELYL